MARYNVVFNIPSNINIVMDADSDAGLEHKAWDMVSRMPFGELMKHYKISASVVRAVSEETFKNAEGEGNESADVVAG